MQAEALICMASPDRKSFLLRIDPKLWAELETWSQQELRSINGQIEYILREAVKRRRTASASDAHGDEPDPGAPSGPTS